MKPLSSQLIYLTAMLLQQSIDFVLVHKNASPINYGILNLLNFVNIELLISLVIFSTLINAASLILKFLYTVQTQWFQVIQLFSLPITIISSSIILKNVIDNQSRFPIAIIFVLILSILHQIIKITSFSNRNNIQINYIYAKIIPYFNIFLIVKMVIFSFGPLIIDSDLAVGFALVINLLKTIIYLLKINMEQANIQYIIGISSIWGWFQFLKYLLLILDVNTIFINSFIIFCYFSVIWKPFYLISLLEFKYRPLFLQSKDTDRMNDIPRASLILRQFYSIKNERPIQWSKDFTLTIRQFVYDKQIKESGLKLHDTHEIQAMKTLGNRSVKDDSQKMDKITNMLWDFFMTTNKFYVQDYFYLGIYLCYMFPIKQNNNMLNKLFKLFYTLKFTQKQVSYLEQAQLQFCYHYLNEKISKQSSFKKYFYMEGIISEVLDLFYQFYTNQEKYFNLLSFSNADYLQIKDYLLKKSQIRQVIAQKMDQYKITQTGSNMCLVIEYVIQYHFNKNKNKAKQFISQQLKKRFKAKIQSLTKSYLVSGETMIGLVSGTKIPGRVIYSNNVFKQLLQIKNQKFSKNSQKNYNIHDFIPQFYREKHQLVVSQFAYDNTQVHSNDNCFLINGSHNIMRVRIKISFFYDYLDDLKICVEMKRIEDKSYAIYNQNYQLIYLSKALGLKQQFKQHFIQNSTYNVNSNITNKNQTLDNKGYITLQDTQMKGNKNKVVQIFGKIYFLEIHEVQGVQAHTKTKTKTKWLQTFRQSTNLQFNAYNLKSQKTVVEQINNKKEESFYKCRQKISFLSTKLLHLILIFTIIFFCYLGFMIGIGIRHTNIIKEKTQTVQMIITIQAKYLTNQIFNFLDFGFKQEYFDILTEYPQKIPQFQYYNTILNQSVKENIYNFNVVQNKFLTSTPKVLELIFSQSQRHNSVFKDVIGFYGKYLQSIPFLQMNLDNPKRQNVTKSNFLNSQAAQINYRYAGGLKQIILKKCESFDEAFNLNVKLIYFLFISILAFLYLIFVFGYYNINRSTHNLLELTLNINKQTYKNLYIQAQSLLCLLKKISEISQCRLVRQLENPATQADNKIIKQSESLCTLSQKRIKISLSYEMKKFITVTFVYLFFVIAGIILHSFFVLDRISALNDAEINLGKLNNFTIYFTKSIKQLCIAKHKLFPQRNSKQQYQAMISNVISNSDLSFIREIFPSQQSNQILYTNLCKNNSEKWNCLEFMHQINIQLKPLISTCIGSIQQLSFNTFVPQHMLHGTAKQFAQSYKNLIALKTLNQRISLQAIRFLKQQNNKDYNLQKIINISFTLFCLFSIFNITLLSLRIRIFEKQVFKLTSFENIIRMQKYLYYVNYFYSHQTQIGQQ